MKAWQPCRDQVLQGHTVHFEEAPELGDSRIALDIRINPILGDGGKVAGLTLVARDITQRKEAEARLGEMHRTLVDVSRQAGMAEIATGVLHNVGNTLNSVNVSTSLLAETLHGPRVTSLTKAAQLLREHLPDLGTFLTTDPRENLPRLFTQGFTTKETGHGFGLYISALTAADMKGQLRASSPGPNQGATFTLELPLHAEQAQAS